MKHIKLIITIVVIMLTVGLVMRHQMWIQDIEKELVIIRPLIKADQTIKANARKIGMRKKIMQNTSSRSEEVSAFAQVSRAPKNHPGETYQERGKQDHGNITRHSLSHREEGNLQFEKEPVENIDKYDHDVTETC